MHSALFLDARYGNSGTSAAPLTLAEAEREPGRLVDRVSDTQSLTYKFVFRVDEREVSALHDELLESIGSNHWVYLSDILAALGGRLFQNTPFLPVAVPAHSVSQKFGNQWHVLDRPHGQEIQFTRRILDTVDERLRAFYGCLRNRAPDLQNVPPRIRDRWLRELTPHLRTETIVFPLVPFRNQLKEFLERVAELHLRVFELALPKFDDPARTRLESLLAFDWFRGQDLDISKSEFFDRVRVRYPEFAPTPELRALRITREDWDETRGAPPSHLEPRGQDSGTFSTESDSGGAFTTSWWRDSGLQNELDFIESSLRVIHCKFSAPVFTHAILTGTEVRRWLEGIEIFNGGWSGDPEVVRDDDPDLWEPECRIPNDLTKPTAWASATGRLTYAFFSAPYQSVPLPIFHDLWPELKLACFSESATPELDYRLFRVSTEESDVFINDWWDYFWIAIHRSHRAAVVLFGTATD